MSVIQRKPEETIVPTGTPGNVQAFIEYPRNRNAGKLQAQRDQKLPWFIRIYEPVTELWQVPRPSRVRVWWCYVRHIVFYKRPWTPKAGTNTFERWGQTDALLRCDDTVLFEGEIYKVLGASCFWHEHQWWVQYQARREPNELDKYPFIRQQLYTAFKHCPEPVFTRSDIVELAILAFRNPVQLEELDRLSSQEYYDLFYGLNIGMDIY